MKFLVFALLLTISFLAQAEDKSSGCGLGWQIAPRTSILSSYTRTMTNATASNTLGMTSGTSGCERHSIIMNEKESQHFAEANFNNLMVEMAQGQGEFLTAFATTFGCNETVFSSETQKNYKQIFSSENVTPMLMHENVKNVILQNPNLTLNCRITTI